MDQNKEELRNIVYKKLIENHISTPHFIGRIPDFKGSEKAADNLSSTKEWNISEIIFSSPDTAQRWVRENALKDGKTLIMVTPKIENGYLKLEAQDLEGREREGSTIEGAFKYGEKIEKLPRVDLVVEGSVAVDKTGGRLGKGGGYGDREIE